MSPVVFSQSRYHILHKTFTLTPAGVNVDYGGVTSRVRFEVPFENIPDQGIDVTTRSETDLRMMVIFSVIAVIALVATMVEGKVGAGVYFILLPIFWAAKFYHSNETYLLFQCGDKSIELYKNKPNEREVREFVETMQTKKRAYLTSKYLPLQGGNIIDELRKLAWLKESGAINEVEFERLKAVLFEGLRKPHGDIGFRN